MIAGTDSRRSYPRTVVRLACLLQRKGDIAKLSLTVRIKELRFREFKMMRCQYKLSVADLLRALAFLPVDRLSDKAFGLAGVAPSGKRCPLACFEVLVV